VPVHRVSQGSGIMLMTDAEISEMLDLGRKAGIEVNLFHRPRATFDSARRLSPPPANRSASRCAAPINWSSPWRTFKRAVRLGLRSVLVSDIGILQIVANMRAAGELPIDLIIKTSVMMAPTNPASARIIELLGANTINIPSISPFPQISAIRAAIDTPIDFYVEAPEQYRRFYAITTSRS